VARFRRRERLGWIVIACLLIALSVAIAMVYLRRAPEARVVRFEVTPRDIAASDALGPPSISPDGQYVAFFKGASGQWRMWLHSLKTLVTNPLPGTENIQPMGFSWSPDSREIAFSTGSALKRISITGGSPQTICDFTGDDIAWNEMT
jgi:dipeptidyl aminopeptidase/acylaminoacyl peptidase